MSERETRSAGAARRPEAASPSAKPLRRSQRLSGSSPPSVVPETSRKAPHATPARKPIVLKKIVARAVEIAAVSTPRRSPRIAFFLEKENNPPPDKEPARENLFKTSSVPVTPAPTHVLVSQHLEASPQRENLDDRDLEMSKKVRRSYSRLEGFASTSTPGRRTCFGFERLLAEDSLATVSPVVCSKPSEVTSYPMKAWAPDTTLPGISPPAVKEKRKKKKLPEILKSELDEWAAAMNAEFEAAEQFDLLVE
ncbi:PREDICTED: sororin-like [Elephantulus edwardii]|uniref:sororin-like n=1 Tax=Elephantulus edwardii TaxID=28737 RepID=UPI0003F09B7C|nr:PREDICTED: sororin-like [Elephantulus edwardii]